MTLISLFSCSNKLLLSLGSRRSEVQTKVHDATSGAVIDGSFLLGAVGQLQFEVVAQRLKDEYKVDAIFENADIHTARWLTFPDEASRKNFEREQFSRFAHDVDGNPVYLASSRYNLDVTMEKWPQVQFHATREHGEKLG